MSAGTVVRIQDPQGRGPWRPGFSHVWVEDRPDHDLLLPWWQEMGWVNHKATPHMYIGCGCRTVEQLRRWFTPGEYRTLLLYGYRAVTLEVGRILGESEIQVVFERARPLREAGQAFDLYPVEVLTHGA